MTDFKYAKLRGKIKEKYGTETNFANALGISHNSLSRKFNDKIQFSSKEIRNWCDILDIPVKDIGSYFFN